MNISKLLLLIIILILVSSCAERRSIAFVLKNNPKNLQTIKFKTEEINNWQHKDIIEDTIPGISLDKAYRELLKKKKGKTVVVAVIDEVVDVGHQDLKNQFWINKDEIPNNGIDDDGNGYIDDVQGWNFIGNSKGEHIIYANMESVRIIRKFGYKFKDFKDGDSIKDKNFILYKKALKEYAVLKKDMKEELDYIVYLPIGFQKAKDAVKKFFPNEKYELAKLDSLYGVYQNTDKVLAKHIYYLSDCLKYGLTNEWIVNYKYDVDEKINKCINIDYNDRIITGDNPENIDDIGYGNNVLTANLNILKHATKVSGVLAAQRSNNIGIKGISDDIAIMPLSIAGFGNENDKDIALAIRYAVDNGAKVINMSFGKELSLNEVWVLDAIKYAAQKNVLIVSGSGNGSKNINSDSPFYPNDSDYTTIEVSDNFLKVGSISYNLNEKLISSFSNYSKEHVDLFAPGENIYTTLPGDEYDYVKGTSFSTPIVSGIAALIWSYYPNLSASEVKHILMDSGLSIPINVQVPGATEGTLKPFSELSKSGKVVNAYNALLMAKEVAKKKKKKR